MTTATKELPATEAELTGLLERRHAKSGNGGSGEFAFLSQVRNDAGFKATRTFDGMGISLWPSRGFTLHVYEIKVSKSDWKRELAKPDKAEDACSIADHFSIVAPRGCVDVNEVPPTWGYIEAIGGELVDGKVVGRKLRTVRSAPLLTQGIRSTFPAGLVISMLRSAGAVPDADTPSERLVADAVRKALDEQATHHRKTLQEIREGEQDLIQRVRAFERESGVSLGVGYQHMDIHEIAAKVKRAVTNEDQAVRAKAQLVRLRDQLTEVIQGAES